MREVRAPARNDIRRLRRWAQMRNNPESRDPRTYAIIGAAMAVHRELGRGFLEAVYHDALAIELATNQIPFRREVELPVYYKRKRLNASYRADFVCWESVIVEVKALAKLSGTEEAQVINYLKAAGMELGLVFNFGAPSLEYKRFVFTPSVKCAQSGEVRGAQSVESADEYGRGNAPEQREEERRSREPEAQG